VRLCLDEHYSPRIAENLRARGHDAVAVAERQELRGLGDRELLAAMQAERRSLLTENAGDFMPLAHELAARSEEHWGLVLSSPLSMPHGRDTIGLFVEALDQLMVDRFAEDALLNQVWWLQPPE
jgi:hypothetical protein